MRNEGRKRVERHLHGQPPIAECDMRQGKLAGESRGLETLQTGRAVRAKAERPLIRRPQAGFQHADKGRRGSVLDSNRGKHVAGRHALIRTVEDLPITKLSATAEADASGPNPTERKGDLGELGSGEDARIRNTRTQFRSRRWRCWMGRVCHRRRSAGKCRGRRRGGCGRDTERLLEELTAAARGPRRRGSHGVGV